MTDEPFEVVFEARLRYEPEEEMSESAARENMIELLRSEPSFGNIRFEYPDEDEE